MTREVCCVNGVNFLWRCFQIDTLQSFERGIRGKVSVLCLGLAFQYEGLVISMFTCSLSGAEERGEA